MADFGLFDIAASWALEKEGGTARVLQVEEPGDIPDWDHEAGKADSAEQEGQSAVGLHHRGDSDGGQEWENMPALIWTWE